MPSFSDNEKYVIGYENLQFYLRRGLKLKNTLSIRIQSITMGNNILNSTQKKEQKQKNMETKMKKRCTN